MLCSEENLKLYLTDNKLLDDLSETAAQMGFSCWLVGGALRDVLLGRPVTDIDLVTTYDPTRLAQHWAKQQGAHWFWLDKQRQQSRVLLRYGKLEFYFDFAPLRAPTLEQDLHLRDFTINALALPLITPLPDQQLIDPLQGRNDLRSSCLKHCSERSLEDDPLRILKGIRHCVTLGLQITGETESRMREHAVGLTITAGERKRNELGRIFSSGRLEEGLRLLEQCWLLPFLFGQPSERFTMAVAISELVELERTLDQWPDRESLAALLEETYDETINRRTLYLLALFLKNYRSEGLEALLAERLRFSRRAVTTIEKLVNLDFACFSAVETLPDSSRAKVLWLDSLGVSAIDQLLFFAMVEQPETLTVSKVLALLDDYSSSQVHGRIPDILSGRDIKRLFPAIDNRRIGYYQKKIKEAEITGEISSRKEAQNLISAENSIDKN